MWTGRTLRVTMLLPAPVVALALTLLPSSSARGQPTGGVWAAQAPLPTARHNLAATAGDGPVYAVGGMAGLVRPMAATVEAYDPATQTWTTRAPLPTARYRLAAAIVAGRLYAVGGSTRDLNATVEEYDPATDSWATRGPMPADSRANVGVAGAGGRIWRADRPSRGAGRCRAGNASERNPAGTSLGATRAGGTASRSSPIRSRRRDDVV